MQQDAATSFAWKNGFTNSGLDFMCTVTFLMGQYRPLFCLFSFCSHSNNNNTDTTTTLLIEKAQMVCLGFEPGAAVWQVQTKPRSYGGHPCTVTFYLTFIFSSSRCCPKAKAVASKFASLRQKVSFFALCVPPADTAPILQEVEETVL